MLLNVSHLSQHVCEKHNPRIILLCRCETHFLVDNTNGLAFYPKRIFSIGDMNTHTNIQHRIMIIIVDKCQVGASTPSHFLLFCFIPSMTHSLLFFLSVSSFCVFFWKVDNISPKFFWVFGRIGHKKMFRCQQQAANSKQQKKKT